MSLNDILVSKKNADILAEMWEDYVGWDQRIKGEKGFLLNQLREHNAINILDSAIGDGADALYLLKSGFMIKANEINSSFRKKAIDNARKYGLKITPTALDWRELTTHYKTNSFDAVLCLGNSITLLFGNENQIRAVKEFYSLLKPDGILLIDERNYQKILSKYSAGEDFHASGKYVYTGLDKIDIKVIEINNDFWILEYTNKKNGKKGYYKGYPFKKNELQSILKKAGFSNVIMYSDYKQGYNKEADYFQYVCIK